MAKCPACEREMTERVGCTQAECEIAGVFYPRVPYGADEVRGCHDCRCPPGSLHHPGCDAERCPACGGQAISCGCGQEDDGD